jgi:hemerythrin-like domain-containing protein/quercetin dioxygenase-like cupin family protein
VNVYSLNFAEKFVQPVLDNGVSKVVHFSFHAGKVLEKHKTSSDILVFVLRGRITFRADRAVDLKAGDMVSVEKHVEHSIEAHEESVVAVVMTPSPSMHTILKPEAGGVAPQVHHHPETINPDAKAGIAPELLSFVEEHAELLQVLDRAIGGGKYEAGAYKTADEMIDEELQQHFRYEEEILFPVLGGYIGTQAGPIAVMLGEHAMIRKQHAAFHECLQELAAGKGSEVKAVKAFEPLESFLRAHIMKEDNVLFPMASKVLSAEDKREVARKVQAEKA